MSQSNYSQAEGSDEHVYTPEEIDALDLLDSVEDSLRRVVRGVRSKVLPSVHEEEPTAVENAAAQRPLTAAAIAAASGFALGLVVRRFVPKRFR